MGVNTGRNYRIGATRKRSQTHDPQNDEFVKREKDTGQFVDQKKDHTPFKGVRKERSRS